MHPARVNAKASQERAKETKREEEEGEGEGERERERERAGTGERGNGTTGERAPPRRACTCPTHTRHHERPAMIPSKAAPLERGRRSQHQIPRTPRRVCHHHHQVPPQAHMCRRRLHSPPLRSQHMHGAVPPPAKLAPAKRVTQSHATTVRPSRAAPYLCANCAPPPPPPPIPQGQGTRPGASPPGTGAEWFPSCRK